MEPHCGCEGVKTLVRWVIIETLARNENRSSWSKTLDLQAGPQGGMGSVPWGMILGPLLTLLVCV